MGSATRSVARRAVVTALWTGALLALGSTLRPASAHVVLSRASLRQFVQYSAATVVARIEGGPRTWVAPDGDRQDVWRIRVQQVLALTGDPAERPALAAGDELDVFFHAEGLPTYAAGDRALLFLEVTAGRSEFAGLAAGLPWFSVQGPGDEWKLEGAETDAVLQQVRAWRAWITAADEDADGLRAVLLAGLASGSDRLEADSLGELMRLSSTPGLLDRDAAVDALVERISDRSLPLSRRVALLRLVDRRLGPRSGALWSGLVASVTSTDDAIALAGLAGARPDPAVAAWLRERTGDARAEVRRAAWRAIARAPSASDLPALRRASEDADSTVARAAIQGLASLDLPAAREQLAGLAGGSDPERSRWAAAALRRAGEPSGADGVMR